MTSSTTGLAGIIEGIDARLAELQPLVEEYNQLQAARTALNAVDPTAASASRGRVRATQTAGSARPAATPSGRAPRGANRAAILAFVGANPGATVAEISDATGIAKPTLHSTVYGLKRRGDLEASGDGVKLPAAAGATTSAPARAARRATRPRAGRRARRRATRRSAARRAPRATARPAAATAAREAPAAGERAPAAGE
jgi:hypothetical protein